MSAYCCAEGVETPRVIIAVRGVSLPPDSDDLVPRAVELKEASREKAKAKKAAPAPGTAGAPAPAKTNHPSHVRQGRRPGTS